MPRVRRLLPRRYACADQRHLAIRLLGREVPGLLRRGEHELLLVERRAQRDHLEAGGGQGRLGAVHGGDFVDRVELEEHLAGLHLLVLADVHLDDPPGDRGADRRPVLLDIGIVGGLAAALGQHHIGNPR